MNERTEPVSHTTDEVRTCSYCGEDIPAGESHLRWREVNEDGHGASPRMHPECAAVHLK
jgi:hypothetical protein